VPNRKRVLRPQEGFLASLGKDMNDSFCQVEFASGLVELVESFQGVLTVDWLHKRAAEKFNELLEEEERGVKPEGLDEVEDGPVEKLPP
jgi:hypothetical protein